MRYDHVDIFLDESGDLGFSSPGSSKHLLVCALATPESQRYARLTKKAHRKFRVKGKGAIEFKFNNSSDGIRRYFLEGVAQSDCWIVWGAIEKKNANNSMKVKTDLLYNMVCGKVMMNMFQCTHTKNVHMIVDRRSSKRTSRDAFDHHVENILLTSHAGMFPPECRISHFDSRKSEGLQVHDFVVGAIFQKIERSNNTYFEIIKAKIERGQVYW